MDNEQFLELVNNAYGNLQGQARNDFLLSIKKTIHEDALDKLNAELETNAFNSFQFDDKECILMIAEKYDESFQKITELETTQKMGEKHE